MKKFCTRLLQFFFLPVLLTAVIAFFYFKRDVYQDFGQRNNYSWKYSYQSLGDISTKKLLQNQSVNYNSFIFGSSRVTGLYACYLQHKIKNSRFFHYANWNETIGGIYAKLKLLDSLNYRLDNVFIYMDTDFTFESDGRCNKNDYYLLTGQNKFYYYFNHFRSFIPPLLNYDKIKILLGYKVNDVYPDWESDRETNDSNHQCSSGAWRDYGTFNFDKIYIKRIDSLKNTGILYKRDNVARFKAKQISLTEEQTLLKIQSLLQKHHSNYYIVITPLYDQLKFNPADMGILTRIFKSNVYDFSGVNQFTDNEYNYPDRKHFLPYISKKIADSVIKYNAAGGLYASHINPKKPVPAHY